MAVCLPAATWRMVKAGTYKQFSDIAMDTRCLMLCELMLAHTIDSMQTLLPAQEQPSSMDLEPL